MSFDARSRERLEALGRTLPQKLPPPAPRQAAASATTPAAAATPRHPVESEEDPEALFHALIQASPDGTVPSHLLDRLRSLEQARPSAPGPTTPAAAAGLGPGMAGSGPLPQTGGPTPPRRPRRQGSAATPAAGRASASDRDLYDAFEDLLRGEGDDTPDTLPPTRRQPDPRLLPRPTLRSERPG